MKQLFTKTPLVVIAFLLSIVSCQHDETTNQNEQPESQIKKLDVIGHVVKGDSIRQINKDLNLFLRDRFEESNRFSSEDIESNAYGFTIITDRILQLSGDTYTNYIFNVSRDNPPIDGFENYMLTIFNDGRYMQVLIYYPLIDSENGAMADISSATVTYINDETLLTGVESSPCANTSEEIIEWSDEADCIYFNCTAGGNHSYGQSCSGSPGEQPFKICYGGWVVTGCTSGGGSSSGSGSTNPTDPFPPTGNGGNPTNPVDPNNPDEEIPTVPLIPAWQEVADCINSNSLSDSTQLTSQMITWLQTNANRVMTSLLENHLSNNECSEDVQQDVILIISQTMINNYQWNDIDGFWELYFEDNPQEFLDADLFKSPEGDEYATEVDLYSVLPCFDITTNQLATHEVTIYVDQPVPNSRKPNRGTDAGHTFIEISQTSNGNTINQVIGFYPRGNASPNSPIKPGAFIDDSEEHYDVKMTVKLTPQEFNNTIAYLNTFVDDTPQFNLNTFNCTDFALNVMNNSSVNIPDTTGEWGGYLGIDAGSGSCPSNAGEDIRETNFDTNIATKTTTGGDANKSSKNECYDD